MPRPDFVYCVGLNIECSDKITWCGSDRFPFFSGVEQAAHNGLHGGRLVACPDCVAAIVAGLRNGHEDVGETTMIKE